MSIPRLTLGEPALSGGPPLPIEGARLVLDGPLGPGTSPVQLLIGYHEPTDAEIAAVEQGAVELGVFHDDGVAAVVARAGEGDGRWLVGVRAPLILLGAAPLADGVGEDGAEPEACPAWLALCEAEGAVVRALRRVLVPASLVGAARRVARAQARRFESVADAVRAHECGLRSRTVRDLMGRAAVTARIAP